MFLAVCYDQFEYDYRTDILTVSWEETLTMPHGRLVFWILFSRLNPCSFTTWLSSSTVCSDDWQPVSEWSHLNYLCKKLMLLAWVQSILPWHAEKTDWEAFPCADQSVLQTALNLQITEVLSMFVLLPGASFLQLYTKKQVWVGNNLNVIPPETLFLREI